MPKSVIRYIEKCTGANHNGPAWIAKVQLSKSGKTFYFNGQAFQRAEGGLGIGNHFDLETGEPYWISGVKKQGSNRHWAGAGKIAVEESVAAELCKTLGAAALDESLYEIVPNLPRTDPQKFTKLLNEPL